MNLTLDKMSRLVVPKALRDRFALKPGDELEVTLEPDGIKLRPIHPVPAVSLKEGVLVCTSEVPLTAWDLGVFMDRQREQRNQELAGI